VRRAEEVLAAQSATLAAFCALVEALYKPAYSHAMAIEMINEGRGGHFDPDMVDALLAISEQFCGIAIRFSDNHRTTSTLE